MPCLLILWPISLCVDWFRRTCQCEIGYMPSRPAYKTLEQEFLLFSLCALPISRPRIPVALTAGGCWSDASDGHGHIRAGGHIALRGCRDGARILYASPHPLDRSRSPPASYCIVLSSPSACIFWRRSRIAAFSYALRLRIIAGLSSWCQCLTLR